MSLFSGLLFGIGFYVSYYTATKIVDLWHERYGAMQWWGILLYMIGSWPLAWLASAVVIGLISALYLYALHGGFGAADPIVTKPLVIATLGYPSGTAIVGVGFGVYRAIKHAPTDKT